MSRAVLWSLLIFVGLLVLSYAITGGRFTFGLFVLPLGLIPFILRRRRNKS